MSRQVYRLIAKSRDFSDLRFKVSNAVTSEFEIKDSVINEYTGIPVGLAKLAYANIEYRDIGGELERHLYNKLIKRLVEIDVPVFVMTELDVDVVKEHLGENVAEKVVFYKEYESHVPKKMLELIVAASEREVKEVPRQYPLFKDEQLEEEQDYLMINRNLPIDGEEYVPGLPSSVKKDFEEFDTPVDLEDLKPLADAAERLKDGGYSGPIGDPDFDWEELDDEGKITNMDDFVDGLNKASDLLDEFVDKNFNEDDEK